MQLSSSIVDRCDLDEPCPHRLLAPEPESPATLDGHQRRKDAESGPRERLAAPPLAMEPRALTLRRR